MSNSPDFKVNPENLLRDFCLNRNTVRIFRRKNLPGNGMNNYRTWKGVSGHSCRCHSHCCLFLLQGYGRSARYVSGNGSMWCCNLQFVANRDYEYF